MPCKTFHPVAATIFAGSVFIPAMIWTNPLWLAILFAASAFLATSLSRAGWRTALLAALPLAAVFGITNALFSNRGEISPTQGPLGIPLEPLVYGISMGLKVGLAIIAFMLFGGMTDRDEALSVFSRVAPKSSLLTALSILMMPRLRRDMERIRTAMSLRGSGLDHGGISARVNASRPMLHALLLSSLEGAWDIAAALHCRAFDSGDRTAYRRKKWNRADSVLAAAAVAALALSLVPPASGAGYSFYPRLDPLFRRTDLSFFGPALLLLCAGYFTARSLET